MAFKLTQEQFIEKAIKIHGNKFDYSKVVYNNAKTKVCIICPVHGEFWQLPDNHLNNQGCPICGIKERSDLQKITIEVFIQRAFNIHNTKFDYSLFVCNGNKNKGKIKCNACNTIFEQSISAHLRGQGCPVCRINKLKKIFTYSREEVIKKFIEVHGDKYNYDNFIYKGSHHKSFIKCKKHGLFLQNATNHLSAKGCPNCKASKGELAIKSILDKYNIKSIHQYRIPEVVNELYYDFCLPEYNLLIEFHGIQHYEYIPFFHDGQYTFEDQKNRDDIIRHNAFIYKYNYLEFNYKQLKHLSKEQFEYLLIDKINSSIKVYKGNICLIKMQ